MDDGSCDVLASGVSGILDIRTAGDGEAARYSSRSAPSLPASIDCCVRICGDRAGDGVRGGEDLN